MYDLYLINNVITEINYLIIINTQLYIECIKYLYQNLKYIFINNF